MEFDMLSKYFKTSKIKTESAGYLTRRDKKGNEMFTVRIVVYRQGSDHVAICLENSLIGISENTVDAIKALTFSIESDLYHRAHSKIHFPVVKAGDQYEMMFINEWNRCYRSQLRVSTPKINDIAKKFKNAFSIKNMEACSEFYGMQTAVC